MREYLIDILIVVTLILLAVGALVAGFTHHTCTAEPDPIETIDNI